jgi:phenylpyruvate tautomerase PptA (4-oxalocrotonate tautomerase family)
MPILTVEIVLRPGEILPPALAQQLADRVGEILGSSPGATWVKVYSLPRENYAENGNTEIVDPVFVSVLRARLPSRETMKGEAVRLAQALGEVCGRPQENVHITFQPPGAGRVAFGGKLLEK